MVGQAPQPPRLRVNRLVDSAGLPGRERRMIRPEQESPLWPALLVQASLVRGG